MRLNRVKIALIYIFIAYGGSLTGAVGEEPKPANQVMAPLEMTDEIWNAVVKIAVEQKLLAERRRATAFSDGKNIHVYLPQKPADEKLPEPSESGQSVEVKVPNQVTCATVNVILGADDMKLVGIEYGA